MQGTAVAALQQTQVAGPSPGSLQYSVSAGATMLQGRGQCVVGGFIGMDYSQIMDAHTMEQRTLVSSISEQTKSTHWF